MALFLKGLSTDAKYNADGITNAAVKIRRLITGISNRSDFIQKIIDGEVFLSKMDVQTEKAIATENLKKKKRII